MGGRGVPVWVVQAFSHIYIKSNTTLVIISNFPEVLYIYSFFCLVMALALYHVLYKICNKLSSCLPRMHYAAYCGFLTGFYFSYKLKVGQVCRLCFGHSVVIKNGANKQASGCVFYRLGLNSAHHLCHHRQVYVAGRGGKEKEEERKKTWWRKKNN